MNDKQLDQVLVELSKKLKLAKADVTKLRTAIKDSGVLDTANEDELNERGAYDDFGNARYSYDRHGDKVYGYKSRKEWDEFPTGRRGSVRRTYLKQNFNFSRIKSSDSQLAKYISDGNKAIKADNDFAKKWKYMRYRDDGSDEYKEYDADFKAVCRLKDDVRKQGEALKKRYYEVFKETFKGTNTLILPLEDIHWMKVFQIQIKPATAFVILEGNRAQNDYYVIVREDGVIPEELRKIYPSVYSGPSSIANAFEEYAEKYGLQIVNYHKN